MKTVVKITFTLNGMKKEYSSIGDLVSDILFFYNHLCDINKLSEKWALVATGYCIRCDFPFEHGTVTFEREVGT